MTILSSSERYPLDTVSDTKVWVMMRRVHFHVSDLVANRLHQRMISTTDRRILDALDYARMSGLPSLSAANLCALIPVLLKPQTAASALQRLASRGLVAEAEPLAGSGPAGHRRWGLTEIGAETRSHYCHDTEQVLSQVYGSESDELTKPLLIQALAGVESMNDRMIPVLEFEGGLGVRRPGPPASPWVALRRLHFYIDDLIFREIQTFGVGRAERRVLDALGFARKHGVGGGLNVGTICRLNEAVSRQVVESALTRMAERDWVVRHTDTSKSPGARSRRRWQLSPKGDGIRQIYKRHAQITLRETVDLDEASAPELLALATRAHQFRDARCLPALEHFKRATAA